MNRFVLPMLLCVPMLSCETGFDAEENTITFAGSLQTDTLIIREMLESAGLAYEPISNVAEIEDGRIISVELRYRPLPSVPSSICSLAALKYLYIVGSNSLTSLPQTITQLGRLAVSIR